MAEEIIEPAEPGVVEPVVEEVEEISGEFDANDTIVDDDGKVVQAFDREKNKTYVVKGKGLVEPKPPADEEAKAKADAEAKAKADADAKAAADKGGAKGADDKEKITDFVNAADYVLKKSGYEKDEVDLGDGTVVKIADLTDQQQLDIMIAEYENASVAYEEKLKELEAREPELKFEDPSANQMLEYLKSGGDIKKLAKEILSRDPAAQAKMLSDEDVVRLGIRKEFSEYTDEEVEEEFKEMSAEKVARRAKALRAKMEKEKPDFSNLTEEQKGINAQRVLQEQETHKGEVNLVKSAAAELKEIAGIPLNEQVNSFLLKQVITDSPEEDSAFVKGLEKNPKKLLTLQFWDTYGEKLMEATRKKYFEMGLKEGNKGKEGLSDDPIRSYNIGAKPEKKVVKKDLNDFTEKEWKDFINADF